MNFSSAILAEHYDDLMFGRYVDEKEMCEFDELLYTAHNHQYEDYEDE